MIPKPASLIALLSVLFFLALPAAANVDAQAKARPVFARRPVAPLAGAENLSFCSRMQVSHTGAICESPYGFTARLAFPQVDVDSVLAGEQFFPNIEGAFPAKNQQINGVQYRNIIFVLRWESTTPDFLQVYMTDILPGWEGKGIPYRLLWRASYEFCAARSCEAWTEIKDRGEYLPLDIPDLPSELAADSNFNGVPASFWNTNLAVK